MTTKTEQHTPGPWKAHDDDGTGTLPCVLSDKVNAGGNFYVAQCNNFEDAKLIAAAPKMLRALREIRDDPHCVYEGTASYGDGVADGHRCAANKARAAIAAAEDRRLSLAWTREQADRVQALAQAQEVSAWIREAIDQRLARDEPQIAKE